MCITLHSKFRLYEPVSCSSHQSSLLGGSSMFSVLVLLGSSAKTNVFGLLNDGKQWSENDFVENSKCRGNTKCLKQ